MKAYLLLILLGLASAAVDYSTLATWSGVSACNKADPWDQTVYSFQSPVYLSNSICFPYGFFAISMADVTAKTLVADGTIGAMKVDAYTDTKLTLDDKVYTSTAIAFRARAEHRLYTDNLLELSKSGLDESQSDIEMQILMKDSTGENAVFSVLFKKYDSKQKYQESVYTNLNIFKTLTTAGAATINLSTLSLLLNSKIESGLFLNIHRYNGTLTYPPCDKAVWFIYGTQLYVDEIVITNLQSLMVANAATIGTLNTTISGVSQNARPFTAATAGQSGAGGGVQYAVRMCFTGYFDIYLNWNFCLWFGVVIVVFYFIITLSTGEKPITDPDYQEEAKTVHPLVSIWKVGNEIHTRKTRASLILTMMTMNALFSSTFYNVSGNRERPSNIIVYAIYSMLISQAITFFHGAILRHYYVAKRHFLQTKDEKWNQAAQNRLFAFYVLLFIFIIVGWPVAVYNNDRYDGKHQIKASEYWVATFFVCLGLEWFFMDVVKALLAWKVGFFRNLFKWNGYFYDNLCHQTYMDYIKQD